MTNDIQKITQVVNSIFDEYNRAAELNPPFNNSHEGWVVIKKEVDELWEEVRKHKSVRSKQTMAKEAAQIGAMALRFIIDLCMDEELLK